MISRLILLIEHTLYDFNSFMSIEICFMTQEMVYLDLCPIGSWKECVFFHCWGILYKYGLDRFGWWCCWVLVYLFQFSNKLFHKILKERGRSLKLYLWICILLSILSGLFHIVCISVAWGIHRMLLCLLCGLTLSSVYNVSH